jgi:hypothetical protein
VDQQLEPALRRAHNPKVHYFCHEGWKLNRLPGAGIALIQLNMRVGSAKTVKKGIPELKSAGLITDTTSGEPTLTDKSNKTSV